jgi:translocation and assembly module TamB
MRRARRIIAWSVAGVLLLAAVLVLAALTICNTSGGRSLIERETAQLSSGRVHLTGLGGRLPSSIDIARLELNDGRGVWLTAQRISVRWSPLALFHWDLHIESFEVGRIDVGRQPLSTSSSTSTSSGARLPAVDIDQLSIGTLDLEPAAAGVLARVNVRGNAHYRSMQDVSASLVARRTNGTGDYELALRNSPSRMSANLKLEEPAGGPIEHLTNLTGLGAVSVTATLDGPRNAERVELRARAGELHANASGTLDLERQSADLSYSVESAAMTPRPGLSWGRISLEGRCLGPMHAPQASSVLHLEALRLPDGAQLDTLEADLAADRHLLTLRATAGGVMLPGSQPQLLQGSPIRLDAMLRLDAADRPLQVILTHRLLELRARAITAGAPSATFELRLPDLARLAALYQQDIRGSMNLSGRVSQDSTATRLEVNGTGNVVGSSAAARLLGANTRLHLEATLTAAKADIGRLTLAGRALSASAAGSAERTPAGATGSAVQALHARWQVSLPNLGLISPTLAGSLETSGTASGSLQSLAADLRARSTLSIHGSAPGTVEATLQARGLPAAPRVVVQANGSFDGAPLRLDASLERVGRSGFHVVVQRTAWKSLFVNGELTAGPNLAAGHGSVRLRIERLADLQRLVGTNLAGSLAADVTLIPSAGRTRAQCELIARDVAMSGISGNARITAAGPLDALRIELAAQSPNLGGAAASLSSAARLNETARVLDLDSLEARYRGQTLRLLSASRVMFANGLSVRNLRLGAQKAVVSVDGQLSPALDLRASVHQIDAALIDSFVPNLLAQGTFNADARLRGSPSAPVGQASFAIAGLKLANAAAEGLPALGAHGSARFAGSTADVSAELEAGPASRLSLSGRAPLSAAGAVALKLSGTLDAALMNSILEARGERAAGMLTIDASVAGTARAPQIEGTVRLANGALRDYAEGIHVEDINARLVGSQGVLRIDSLTARAGPGQLSAKGTLGVLQPQMPIDVQLFAERIQPITNDILTANLDTRMRVAGTLRQRLDVTGSMHINRASISIPNGLPPNVAVLEVEVPGQPAQPAPTAPRLVIGLAVTLDAPQSIFVQGRGLDAQLGGKLELTGTSDNPQVNGRFSMIRGAFSLAGTNLRFTSGEVSFNGAGLKGRIDPTLDFLAQASVTYTQATTVTLHITGFADSPEISLSSTPPLPQDDLLALLLFGKPASQLSAFQLAETGAALASLSGVGGGGGNSSLNPLTKIKSLLGLNTLSVGSAAPPAGATTSSGTQPAGASVTGGKYVSNRVYVAATQTTNGTSQVEVDVDLSQNLKLQTRLGNGTATAQGTTPENDPGSSIGLTYQFHY